MVNLMSFTQLKDFWWGRSRLEINSFSFFFIFFLTNLELKETEYNGKVDVINEFDWILMSDHWSIKLTWSSQMHSLSSSFVFLSDSCDDVFASSNESWVANIGKGSGVGGIGISTFSASGSFSGSTIRDPSVPLSSNRCTLLDDTLLMFLFFGGSSSPSSSGSEANDGFFDGGTEVEISSGCFNIWTDSSVPPLSSRSIFGSDKAESGLDMEWFWISCSESWKARNLIQHLTFGWAKEK